MSNETETKTPKTDEEVDNWLAESVDAYTHAGNLVLAKMLDLIDSIGEAYEEEKT
jgi:hypothetical protein